MRSIVLFLGTFYTGTAMADPTECPLHAFTAQTAAEVVIMEDIATGDLRYYDADNDWKRTPATADPTTVDWSDDFTAVGTNSTSTEWGMGIDTSGNLVGFGGTVPTGIPSGGEPYASPRGSSTAKYSVLDSAGTPHNWGASSYSWLTSAPSVTGLNRLDVGHAVGCGVSDYNSLGVICWGYDIEGLLTHVDRPTSGTFKSVSVGRYVVIAVDTSGNTHAWGTTRTASGMTAKAAAFLAARPMTGVESVEVSEVGELVGVAWMEDGTAVVWQDPTVSLRPALRSAPGFQQFGATTDRTFVPQGPDGPMTFRSQPHLAVYNINSPIAAVVNDPAGLVDARVGTYEYGDAVYWNGSSITVGGVPNYVPILAGTCQ